MAGSDCHHDLLTKPLISVGKAQELSLPGLFAAMARGETIRFPALRPHQRPAWHMFCVQLAALALWHGARTEPPQDEESWQKLLRALTPDYPDDEPWCLIVADRGKPAFLQPPDPGGLKWSQISTPDALDMVITARNHDLKQQVMGHATPEDWLFALVSLQTQNVYNVQYPGTIRAQTNAAARALIACVPASDNDLSRGIDLSHWWLSETRTLLSSRSAIPTEMENEKISLLWTVGWPIGEMLDFFQLDDWFIETILRVRFEFSDKELTARKVAGQKPRIDRAPITKKVNNRKVVTAIKDPWAAVYMSEGFPFNLGSKSFDYRTVADLLFSGNWKLPLVWSNAKPDKTRHQFMLFESLKVIDKSKTGGFASRIIPVPGGVVIRLGAPAMKKLAEEQIKDIGKCDTALRDGLALLAAGGMRDAVKQEHYALTRTARAAFDARADALFFPALWDRVRANAEGTAALDDARRRFRRQLLQAAVEEFNAALPTIPCAALFRPRAETRARAAFFGKLKKEGFETRNTDAPAKETAHEHS